MQGRRGLPLNAQGVEQAEILKEKLHEIKFDYVFSSPQERAIQTAEIATEMKAIIDNRLDNCANVNKSFKIHKFSLIFINSYSFKLFYKIKIIHKLQFILSMFQRTL